MVPAGEAPGVAPEPQLNTDTWCGIADLEDCCPALLPKRLFFGTEDPSSCVTHHDVLLECKEGPLDGSQATNALLDSTEGVPDHGAEAAQPKSPKSAIDCIVADMSSNTVISKGGIAAAELQVAEGKVSHDHSAFGGNLSIMMSAVTGFLPCHVLLLSLGRSVRLDCITYSPSTNDICLMEKFHVHSVRR